MSRRTTIAAARLAAALLTTVALLLWARTCSAAPRTRPPTSTDT